LNVGAGCSEFIAQQPESPEAAWHVWGGSEGEFPIHGYITATGRLRSLFSEWSIETHTARERTGTSAWRDAAEVREFLLPFVRKYASAQAWEQEPSIILTPSELGTKGRRGFLNVQFEQTTDGYPWLDRSVAAHFRLDYESKSVLSAGFSHGVALGPTFHNEVLLTRDEVLGNAVKDAQAKLGWITVPFGSSTETARLTWRIWVTSKGGVFLDATTGALVAADPVITVPPKPENDTGGSEVTAPGRTDRPRVVRRQTAAASETPAEQNRSKPALNRQADPGRLPGWLFGAGAAVVATGLAWLWIQHLLPNPRVGGRP